MKLQDLVNNKRTAVVERWTALIMETYPAETAAFLKRETDPFANPVGSTIARDLGAVLDGLLRGSPPEDLASLIEGIVRIRAVQEFSASQALSFVILLKQAVREKLEGDVLEQGFFRQLLEFESEIDRLVLSAFDTYVTCREKISEVRMKEVKAEKERIERVLKAVTGEQH